MNKPVYRYDIDKKIWLLLEENPMLSYDGLVGALRRSGVVMSDTEEARIARTGNAACMATMDYARQQLHVCDERVVCEYCPRNWGNASDCSSVKSLVWLWDEMCNDNEERAMVARLMRHVPLHFWARTVYSVVE